MADNRPFEIEPSAATDRDEAIRRNDLIRIQVFKLLLDFDPPEHKCALDPILIRARDMFVPDAKRLLGEMSEVYMANEGDEAACDSDQTDSRDVEEKRPRAEDDAIAASGSEASETAVETRSPPPPPPRKRPRERSPAPHFVQYHTPMLLAHNHIMATPPVDLVGRLVRVWRPELGLMSGHAYARVLAYEPELDLHLLVWLFDETVREEVCFRAKEPNAAQLVVQHPTPAFMASLEHHQRKKTRM
jgi:hypothetical protein